MSNLPTLCLWVFILFLPGCSSPDCLPAFSPRALQCLWTLSQRNLLTFKTPGFNPAGCKNSRNWPLLFSKPIATGIHFPCELPCMLVCLSPFPVTAAAMICFSPKGHLHSSYLLSCGLYFLLWSLFFLCLGQFLGYLGWFDSYLVLQEININEIYI